MEDEAFVPFGSLLRRFREAAGLTQEQLAERAGISVKAVSALERGRRQRPYPHTVRALADALDLPDHAKTEFLQAVPSRTHPEVETLSPSISLPMSPTRIIGRAREVEELSDALRDSGVRVVTLTGPGGVGKTRLALEVAARLAEHTFSRVTFVSLATLYDAALVLPEIAQALGVVEDGTASIHESIAANVGGRPWLIVLDSAEHVLDVAPEIAALLADCPEITLLITSRAPLRIRSEREYPVRPLDSPDLSRVPTLDEVERVSSVELFIERAQAAVPTFALTQANCAAVAAICRRLDGLPLALELAAARVRSLGPTDLLARLDHVLRLLVDGSRDLPQRQQTMWAAIDWSYELLKPTQQVLFRHLSVFSNGWTLEAAERVCAIGAIDSDDVLELLSGLVEQSLVTVDTDSNGFVRYRMLEPIRQFARHQGEQTGEIAELSERHFEWFLSFAQHAGGELRGAEQHQWLDKLEIEHDNLRTALNWSQQPNAAGAQELQLATSLWRFWETRGYITEGRRWLEDALERNADVPLELRARGLNAAGNLARDQGDNTRATELHQASLGIRRQQGDEYGQAQSLTNLGNLMLDQGNYEPATRLYSEALSFFREHGEKWDIANASNNLGIALGYLGDYDQAAVALEEALRLREEIGETASRARSLDALGVVMQKRGDSTRAAELHQASLALRQELGDKRGIAIALNNLGVAVKRSGDLDQSRQLIEKSLRLRREIGDRFGIAVSLGSLADVARDEGDASQAIRLYKEALMLQRQIQIKDGIVDSLLGLAIILAARGERERAARFIAASDRLRAEMNLRVPPSNLAEYDAIVAKIQASLGDDVYVEARAKGLELSLGEAIDEALALPDRDQP